MDHLERTIPDSSKIFSGKFIQKISCKSCSNHSYRFESFNTLTLQFPEDKNRTINNEEDNSMKWSSDTLEGILDYAFTEEEMTGENQIFCEKCSKRQDGGKTMLISEAPNHLIIVLSRFSYNFHTNVHSKIFKNVYYPETLELKLATLDDKPRVQMYRLYSSLIHSGLSAQSGHYYTYARSSKEASSGSNGWFKLNDSSVGPSSYDSFSRITESLSKDVPYLLYYVKEGFQVESQTDILPDLTKEVETDNINYTEELKQKKIRQKQQTQINPFLSQMGPGSFEDPDAEGGFNSDNSSGFGGPPIIF
jgi:ubiquitin carboxyl-terminal hydrolase 35/38